MKRVVFNQKGGIGKSTITCNLAVISAAQGACTLDTAAHRARDTRAAQATLAQKPQ